MTKREAKSRMPDSHDLRPAGEHRPGGAPRRSWRRAAVTATLVGLAVLALAAWRRPAPVVVETVPVERRDLENVVTASGRVRPFDFVDVGAQVSGQLARLHVAVGDEVAAGDLLAEIDAEVEAAEVEALRAERAALEAELVENEADLAFAESEQQRTEALVRSNALSRTAAEASRRDAAKGRARVEQTRARIAQAGATLAAREAALRRAAIRAPIAGTIVAIDAREGQTLNANYDTPLVLTIADLDRMTVWTEVSEADVARLREGMPVWFTTLGAPGIRHRSTLRQIQPVPPRAADETSETSMALDAKVIVYLALFDVPNPDRGAQGRALRGGMTAQVAFVEAEAPGALAVPVAALADDGTVRVRASDGSVAPRPVATGLRTRFFAEIRDGLVEGEEVVVAERSTSDPSPIRIAP